MIKVLHVIESLEFGGAEKVVVQLANNMHDNYDISICMTKRRGSLSENINDDIIQYCLNAAEGNDYKVIFQLARILKDNKFDVIHIHNWSVYIEAVIAAKISGTRKIIHTVHGPYMKYKDNIRAKIKKHIRHTIERFLSIYVTQFVAVSEAIKKYMVNDMHLNPSKIKVIHNGVKGIDLSKKSMPSNSSTIRFVMVGRLATIKNHLLVLQAFKELVPSMDIELTIVGDGPEAMNLMSYVNENDLSQSICFLGFRNDVEDILVDKDVFLLTSHYEGISIALLESMSLSIPSIATRVGGMSEVVVDGTTGLLIDDNDKAGLILAIKKLVNNPDVIRKMGACAYDLFIKEFNEDTVIKEYALIYGK